MRGGSRSGAGRPAQSIIRKPVTLNLAAKTIEQMRDLRKMGIRLNLEYEEHIYKMWVARMQ